MLIRRAVPADAAAIAKVDVASWRAAYRDLMPAAYLDGLDVFQKTEDWRRGLARDEARGKRTRVVETEDTLTGFAVVGPDDEAGFGMLWLMYIAPAYWGTGAASPLMDSCVEGLRVLGHETARLWVLEKNLRARRFYERVGWSEDGATGVATHEVDLTTVRYTLRL